MNQIWLVSSALDYIKYVNYVMNKLIHNIYGKDRDKYNDRGMQVEEVSV